jgi:2-iminoacetate synthase ThiH
MILEGLHQHLRTNYFHAQLKSVDQHLETIYIHAFSSQTKVQGMLCPKKKSDKIVNQL